MVVHAVASKMGNSDLGWLRSKFHFSFADYFNPDNVKFGALRVLNDDIILPNTGFDTHPHKNMEIISYVVEGKLVHKDNMGNEGIIERGEVQYMSAGTGVKHSEHNAGTVPLRLLQMWYIPDAMGYKPTYGEHKFQWADRNGAWLHMVTGYSSSNTHVPIKIHQDINIYSSWIQKGSNLQFSGCRGRQWYFVQIEGASAVKSEALDCSDVTTTNLHERDALYGVEESIVVESVEDSHVLLIDMAIENVPSS